LKRALRRLHARQPWIPKPASGADAAARVALAWAWRLGPSGGCGKRGRGAGRRGHSEISASPSDGPPALPLLPGCAALFEAGLLAVPPGRATSPLGRAPPPNPVPVTGAPRVRRRDAPGPGQETANTPGRFRPRVVSTSSFSVNFGGFLGRFLVV
jgi:hypothetical protein